MKKGISKMWKKRLLYYGSLAGFFCAMLWFVAKPYFGARYNYSIGDVSAEDIISPKDITYINVKETEKRIDEVRERVSVVFDFNASINLDVLKTIEMFFSAVREIKLEDVSLDQKVARIKDKSSVDISESLLGDVLKYQENGKFEERVINIVGFVLDTGLSDFKSAELKEYEENGIILKRIEEAEIILEKINTDQIIAADEAGRRINELILENYIDLPPAYRNTIGKIASVFLRPNVFFNSVETEKLKIEEIQKVRPVLNTLKKGAIVLRRGEEITEENYPKLQAVTLYTSNFNLKAIAGIGIFLLLLLYLSIIPFMNEWNRVDFRNYLILLSFVGFTVAYSYLITLIKGIPHHIIFGLLVPTAGITLTAEVLYKRKLSFTLAIVLPIFLLLISGNDPYTFIFSLGSGLVAIYSVRNAEKRSDILKSSLFIVVVNGLILSAIGLLKELSSREFLSLLTWGAGNGIVSVILSLGTVPFFEILFNIPTNFRLLELTDLNAPMLKKLQLEAPGTYHHSINLANMAETAARYIKANPLMVRVAALYHDIGKIPNAEYYIENNQGENKHDLLKPSLSNSILKAHVKMGVDMAKGLKLPKEVIDVIAQHHGTSLMKYFYHQALKNEEEGFEVDKKDYHYLGPKPQTREAAIVMLADAVEAASRTLKNPSAKRIEEFVNGIIESKFREGQLNESRLTLRGLMKISIAFKRYLTGLFHSRIEYPDDREIKKIERNV
jgi:putative nucleotidyltransferase with HDIG domain